MIWENLNNFFKFTGITDVTVWQDVAVSTFLIPVGIIVANKIKVWWSSTRPAHLVLDSSLKNKATVLVFHSQMSGADDNWNFNPDQKYITRYPNPLPTNKSNLAVQKKLRIDPILSQAEADCLADIYNVLGKNGKVTNIVSADLINDWGKWSDPMFSVGFNPKTMKFIEKCEPVYFELNGGGRGGLEITDINHKVTYDAIIPNDAGIIQKTFVKNSKSPVFLLAGLGTLGTAASGYIFSKYIVELGRLFGNAAFCVFLKVSTSEGREAAYIDKVYPSPSLFRKIIHPITYFMFNRKQLFLE